MKKLNVPDEVLGLIIWEPPAVHGGHLEVQPTTDLTGFKMIDLPFADPLYVILGSQDKEESWRGLQSPVLSNSTSPTPTPNTVIQVQ